MNITSPYTYPVLSRIEVAGKRHYSTPGTESVPSVTTILERTADKEFLTKWRDRVGDAAANQISKESSGLGTLMHSHIENHIAGIERPGGKNMVHLLARSMADLIITNGLSKVTEVWGQEVGLYYPDLYAGTADLIGVINGRPAIMDHKTTKTIKKREWITDYFCQLAAYACAHNAVHGTTIDQGMIFMASRDGQYQEFLIQGDEFQHYAVLWATRVNQYYDLLEEPDPK